MLIVYAIYQIRDSNNNYLDVPRLYAFTAKDKLLKKFKAVRKMSIFKVFTREMSGKDFMNFKAKYSTKELDDRKIYTKSDDGVTKRVMRVVCTFEEIEMPVVHSDSIVMDAARFTKINVSLLSDQYIKALKTLGFFEFMKFSDTTDAYIGSSFNTDYPFDIGDYRNDNRLLKLEFDEFALLMYFYGYTFK